MNIYEKRTRRGVPWGGVIALIVLTAVVSGGLAFLWQASALKSVYDRNDALNNQISSLENENKSMKAQNSDLEKELKTAEEQRQEEVPEGKREAVQSLSDRILHILKDKDTAKLAEFVHPEKGIRFTPYPNVDVNKDVRISSDELAGLMTDAKKRKWGEYDGTGDPIDMTFAEYYDKFVYDADFLEAPQIIFNQQVQRGNSLLNIDKAYPGASFIEYHYPGADPKYEGMDWKSLYLVFEEIDGKLYLTGIIHGQWTT